MPHPFRWVPADGARHASADRRAFDGYPTGMPVDTLCGLSLFADNTQRGWLWLTCTACDSAARSLAGAPPRRSKGGDRD